MSLVDNPKPKLTRKEWFMDSGDYSLLPNAESKHVDEDTWEAADKYRDLCHQVLWWRNYMAIVPPRFMSGAATSFSNARSDLADFIADNLISNGIDATTLDKLTDTEAGEH